MTRRKKIILFLAAAAVLLAVALTVWFPGLTPPVKGLSSQDIKEIRGPVQRQIWYLFCHLYMPRLPYRLLHAHAKQIPFIMRETFLTTVAPPQQWDNVSGQDTVINGQTTVWPDNTWIVPTSDGQAYVLQKIGGQWRLKWHW